MKLTTKGKFAVEALLDIAIHSNNHAVNLNDISKRRHISVSYLEQLFMKMRKADLVKSLKGPGGGYLLARSESAINIAEVIYAVEDDLDARSCHGNKDCRENNQCLAHNLWSELTSNISDYLKTITLEDIIESKNNQTKIITFSKNISSKIL